MQEYVIFIKLSLENICFANTGLFTYVTLTNKRLSYKWHYHYFPLYKWNEPKCMDFWVMINLFVKENVLLFLYNIFHIIIQQRVMSNQIMRSTFYAQSHSMTYIHVYKRIRLCGIVHRWAWVFKKSKIHSKRKYSIFLGEYLNPD